MTSIDVIDEVVVAAPPSKVWEALMGELTGRTDYWLPHNTFEPGDTPPDQVGGETFGTVHTRGVHRRGLRLNFTARTVEVDAPNRLRADYVAGSFRGGARFDLIALEQGAWTKLTMRFMARPHGPLRLLAKVVDIGAEHSAATRHAFGRLAHDLGEPARI